jgi:hypothetical protein
MFERFNAPKEGAQSRRDSPIVAWHEVPGTAPPQKNRPVGHGMIGRRPNPFRVKRCAVFFRKANSNHRIGANQTVPYGTALLRWGCPRHFVPGYDRTVPPGLGARPLRLRGNKSSEIFPNLVPFEPWAMLFCPFGADPLGCVTELNTYGFRLDGPFTRSGASILYLLFILLNTRGSGTNH